LASGLLQPSGLNPLSHHRGGFGKFRIEYLGEYQTIGETVLTCLSGTYIEFIDEKTEGRKSRATVPLKIHTL
jgi:hypothetical protein